MKTNNKDLVETSPEIKSFVYQQLIVFEPFITPQTLVQVVEKNPLHLAEQLASQGRQINKSDLKKMHRVVITMTEGQGRIEEEGLSESIYVAILEAKDKLYKKLEGIHNSNENSKERLNLILMATKNLTLH